MTGVLLFVYLGLVKLLYRWAAAQADGPLPNDNSSKCSSAGTGRLPLPLTYSRFSLSTPPPRADPNVLFDLSRRPRPRPSGPMADVRMAAGDRELLPGGMSGTAEGYYNRRSYRPERPGDAASLMDDVAWYERRYPDSPGDARGGGGGKGERVVPKRNTRSFLPSADEP